MKRPLMTLAVLGLMMIGIGHASAVSVRGDCGCTEFPPHCDPDKDLVSNDLARTASDPNKLVLAEKGRYITDEDGDVWYCEKGECFPTGVRVS